MYARGSRARNVDAMDRTLVHRPMRRQPPVVCGHDAAGVRLGRRRRWRRRVCPPTRDRHASDGPSQLRWGDDVRFGLVAPEAMASVDAPAFGLAFASSNRTTRWFSPSSWPSSGNEVAETSVSGRCPLRCACASVRQSRSRGDTVINRTDGVASALRVLCSQAICCLPLLLDGAVAEAQPVAVGDEFVVGEATGSYQDVERSRSLASRSALISLVPNPTSTEAVARRPPTPCSRCESPWAWRSRRTPAT